MSEDAETIFIFVASYVVYVLFVLCMASISSRFVSRYSKVFCKFNIFGIGMNGNKACHKKILADKSKRKPTPKANRP